MGIGLTSYGISYRLTHNEAKQPNRSNAMITLTNVAYEVIDIQTKAVIKQYPAGKGSTARAYANKKDLAYGAVRYIVRLI